MADLTFVCPECSNNLIVDDQAVGQVVACPECGIQIRVPTVDGKAITAELESVGEEMPSQPEDVPGGQSVSAPEMTTGNRLEYQVVSVLADNSETREIRAHGVAATLNEQAQDGWQLRTVTAIQAHDEHGKPQQELLLFMERIV